MTDGQELISARHSNRIVRRLTVGNLLIMLLLAALALRIWGIWFGLPFIFHNDEGNEVLRALQLGLGQFNFERIDKGVYFYLLFIEYGILFVVLKVFGIVSSAGEFGEYFIRDPSVFYLIGRATTALLGVATVYIVFKIGRLAYSAAAAAIGAAILAVNVLHADLSHFVTVDVPLAFFAAASLYFAVRMVRDHAPRDYWFAAAMAALATATKTPGILLIVPLVIAHVLVVHEGARGASGYVMNSTFWTAVAVFLLTYIVVNPGIVVHIDGAVVRYAGKFIGDDAATAYVADDSLDERALFANTNLFLFYARVTIESMTWPVFLVCLSGALYAAWRREAADIILLSFVLVTYVVLSLSNDPFQFFPRYILPVLPCLALFGGRVLWAGLSRVPEAKRGGVALAAVIVLAILPVSSIVEANILLTRPDTRALAKAWFDANIEDGAKVFIEGTTSGPTQGTVPLQNSPKNLREVIADFKDSSPGKAKYFRMALNVQSGKSYDLLTVTPTELKGLEFYKRQGVQYFVLRPENYPGSRVRFHWPALVSALRADPEITMIKRFEADRQTTPGPIIEIYRVDSNLGGGEQ